MSTPNPNQSGNQRPGSARPVQIQHSQATQLVQALKNEVAMAKAAGNDSAKAQQHYAKAESIKQVLLNYQAQQKARMAQQQAPGSGNSSAGGQAPGNLAQRPSTAGMAGSPQSAPTPQPQQLAAQQQFQQQQGGNVQSPVNRTAGIGPASTMQGQQAQRVGSSGTPFSAPTPGVDLNNMQPRQGSPGIGGLPSSAITVDNFNQVKTRLGEFERKIQQLQNSKKNFTLPEQVAQIESQLTELKNKYTKYQKLAYYMKAQLVEQARNQQALTGQTQSLQAPGQTQSTTQPSGPAGPAQSNVSPNISTPTGAGGSQMGRSASPVAQPQALQQQATNQAQNKTAAMAKGPGQVPAQGSQSTPSSQAQSTQLPSAAASSPSKVNSSVNLAGITKPSAPSLPISNTINVKPPTAVTVKGNTMSRPTLTGGVANGVGQVLGTPAIMKLPSYELANTNNGNSIPDNGGRVLTKRKLGELVQTIGADQGDGKTVIDGDVEELLLDLADEFINSVTGFACRLAKHRKVESIDARDVQLHLERNWNIRIPGYSMDEIKSTRKWQPSPSYQQKLSGVEISKSVNDINR